MFNWKDSIRGKAVNDSNSLRNGGKRRKPFSTRIVKMNHVISGSWDSNEVIDSNAWREERDLDGHDIDAWNFS